MIVSNNANFALHLKSLMISNNKRDEKLAIDLIKGKLATDNDPEFISLLLENDILNFLLNSLADLTPYSGDIISCLYYLSEDRLFFYNEYLNRTAITIIRTAYYLAKNQKIKQVTILGDLLKLLASLYQRLNFCSSFKNLYTDLALSAIQEILGSNQHPDIYLSTLHLIKSIVSYKYVNKLLYDKNFIYKITSVVTKLLQLLGDIWGIKTESQKTLVLNLSDSCKEFLIFSKHFLNLKLQDVYHTFVHLCLDVHNKFCLNLINDLNIEKHFPVYYYYLQFLTELFESNITIEERKILSKSLIEKNIFVKIADNLKIVKSLEGLDFEEKLKYRNDTLKILCVVMAYESLEQLHDVSILSPYIKHLNEGLRRTTNDISGWGAMLLDHTTTPYTMDSIIIFWSFYYLHSKNFRQLKKSNCTYLMKYIIILKNANSILDITLKHLYLLYTVYYSQHNDIQSEYFTIVSKAGKSLQNILNILQDAKTIDTLTSDIIILLWIFTGPVLYRDIEIKVVQKWLQVAKDSKYCYVLLAYYAKNIRRFRHLLVTLVSKNCYDNVLVAANILKFLFINKYFKNDKQFIAHINNVMYGSLNHLLRNSNPEQVFKKIELINLSLKVLPEQTDRDKLFFTIRTFIDVFTCIGFDDKYPLSFYKAILKATNLTIHQVKKHKLEEIQSEFINAKRFLKISGYCLMSKDPKLSMEATKFFKEILLYQFKQRKNSHCTVQVDEIFFVKSLCLKNDNYLTNDEILRENIFLASRILNLTIYKIDPVIRYYQRNEMFFVFMYKRIINLLLNTKSKSTIKNTDCFTILKGILYYGCKLKNDINFGYLLLNNFQNNILIQMQYERKEMSEHYLQFLFTLLELLNSNMEIKTLLKRSYNSFGISPIWKLSLHELTYHVLRIDDSFKSKHLYWCFNVAKQLTLFNDVISTYFINKLKQMYNI